MCHGSRSCPRPGHARATASEVRRDAARSPARVQDVFRAIHFCGIDVGTCLSRGRCVRDITSAGHRRWKATANAPPVGEFGGLSTAVIAPFALSRSPAIWDSRRTRRARRTRRSRRTAFRFASLVDRLAPSAFEPVDLRLSLSLAQLRGHLPRASNPFMRPSAGLPDRWRHCERRAIVETSVFSSSHPSGSVEFGVLSSRVAATMRLGGSS